MVMVVNGSVDCGCMFCDLRFGLIGSGRGSLMEHPDWETLFLNPQNNGVPLKSPVYRERSLNHYMMLGT